jgi:hypothetical protein
LTRDDDEQIFTNYLLQGSLPDLIIKIIGADNEQTEDLSRASIQKAFKQVICNIMGQTSE